MGDRYLLRIACLAIALTMAASAQQLTLEIKDFATMPMTGAVDGVSNAALLARLNSMREEPG
jgi:hypothetical protein